MGLSPLTLQSYIIEEFQFKLNKDYDAKEKEGLEGFDIFFLPEINSKNKLKRRVTLSVVQTPQTNNLYEYKLRLVGIFEMQKEYAKEQKPAYLEQLMNVNCPAMLYAAAREIILQFTSRSPGGAVFLPSINFAAFVKSGPTQE